MSQNSQILKEIAPCGLVCRTCISGQNSLIVENALELQKLLQGFENLAERVVSFDKDYENYPSFALILNKFTKGHCGGCREGKGIHSKCIIPECTKEKSLDFCSECPEFPCDKTNFPPDLQEKWQRVSQKMKDMGKEKYWQESRNKPHYKK